MTTPKRHYANKAARDFLRGTAFDSPDDAIQAGARSEFQWQTFMLGRAAKFWRENGAKARRKVKARHPVKRTRRKKGADLPPPPAENGSKRLQSAGIGDRKLRKDVQALENKAREWANVGGIGRTGLDKSARAAYDLWLDFTRHGIGGEFAVWLSAHSGASYDTCRRRLKVGMALNLGINPRMNQSGLISELRERETLVLPWNAEPAELEVG